MLEGKLTISRTSSNRGPGWVSIELVDESSGCNAFEIKISPEHFAEAILGLARVECKYEPTIAPAILGARHEYRTIAVRLPDGHHKLDANDPAIRAILAEHEVDGWRADGHWINNSHQGPREARRMIYRRYIGPDGKPIELPPR